MRLTKMGHACVRLEKDGEILVIDPGTLTEPEALDGAEAVLITHEHPDHVDRDRLEIAAQRTPQLEIWTTAALAGQLEGLGANVHDDHISCGSGARPVCAHRAREGAASATPKSTARRRSRGGTMTIEGKQNAARRGGEGRSISRRCRVLRTPIYVTDRTMCR